MSYTTFDNNSYNPENYLVVSVPIPAECEIYASKEEPLLALIVDIDIGMLNRIISHMDEHIDHSLLKRGEKHKGIYVAASNIGDQRCCLEALVSTPVTDRIQCTGQGARL